MKIIAIALMLLGAVLAVGVGFFGFYMFAMSFDAPGSISSPKAWGARLLLFLPALLILALLFWAFQAYREGHFMRSVSIGALFAATFAVAFIYSQWATSDGLRKGREEQLQREEEARLYPTHSFIRSVPGGADTIIVFPTRMVAHRIFDGPKMPIGGLVGYLTESRTEIILEEESKSLIKRHELSQFKDEEGRSFTERYPIQQ